MMNDDLWMFPNITHMYMNLKEVLNWRPSQHVITTSSISGPFNACRGDLDGPHRASLLISHTSCREHHETFANNSDSPAHRSSSPNDHRILHPSVLPTMSSTSAAEHPPRHPTASPFLRLPTELRLQIYSLLLFPRQSTDLLCSWDKLDASAVDAVDYDQWGIQDGVVTPDPLNHPTLRIRSVDPTKYQSRFANRPHTRTSYSVRADRFANRCMATTYHCVNVPHIGDNLAILRTNRQIHAEAAELMYSSYTFDFDTHIEAIIPFLRDLTPLARSYVKNIRLTKRALAYIKEFDRCEWENAWRYLTNAENNINIRRLELAVIAGRPGDNGWDGVATYSAADFNLLKTQEGMEWLQYVEEIGPVQELEVQAIVEHCPSITSSNAMASYVRFSASVEAGFAEYLRGRLLAPEAQRRLAGSEPCWA